MALIILSLFLNCKWVYSSYDLSAWAYANHEEKSGLAIDMIKIKYFIPFASNEQQKVEEDYLLVNFLIHHGSRALLEKMLYSKTPFFRVVGALGLMAQRVSGCEELILHLKYDENEIPFCDDPAWKEYGDFYCHSYTVNQYIIDVTIRNRLILFPLDENAINWEDLKSRKNH